MMWLTWRQHRIEIVGLLIGAVLLAVITTLAAAFAQRTRLELGVDTCVPLPTTNMNCVQLSQEWTNRVGPFRYLFHAFFVVPALIASYIGGPLFARELERGTHRLAWTQGISRLRWAATFLGILLAVALAAAIVLALVGGQTRVFLFRDVYRPWDTFDQEGPAFVSFVMFGLALGAFIGTWRRRILPGMFWGLAIFALARGVILFDLRPSYETPVAVQLTPFNPSIPGPFQIPSPIPSDAWSIGGDAVDGQGHPVPQQRVVALMDEYSRVGCRAGQRCSSVAYLNERDVFQRQLYQPADRYWRFQFAEAAIYCALTIVLVALTLILLKRRDA
jgi:hypothetical protein